MCSEFCFRRNNSDFAEIIDIALQSKWTMQRIIVDQTHSVLASGKLVLQKVLLSDVTRKSQLKLTVYFISRYFQVVTGDKIESWLHRKALSRSYPYLSYSDLARCHGLVV